jgi:hypothetical protein
MDKPSRAPEPPAPTHSLPPATLLDSLLQRQRAHWRLGQPLLVEELLKDHPELQADGEALLTLVRQEIVLRVESGAKPRLEDYQQRFPERSAELKNLFEIDSTPARAGREAPPVPEVDGYEILGELGRGGMGVVYKAWQCAARRLVALKMLRGADTASPEDLSRFRTEVEAAARLQHPYVVPVFEVRLEGAGPFFSMEYVAGGSLDQQVQGTPRLPAEAALLVRKLVQAAHTLGVVHRDLKPANVMLTADGQPKITDFGLAKLLLGGSEQTRTGAILGTPSYMTPEQTSGQSAAVGPSADIYALGVLLYELLTGRPPFRAATMLETLQQVRNREPVPPTHLQPGIPRDLETICLKCLQKEPARRYASASALAEDLERFLDGKPITARPLGAGERLWRWGRRNPVVATLTATLLLTFLGGFAAVTSLWLHAEDQRRAADAATQLADRRAQTEEQQRQRAETARQQAADRAGELQKALLRSLALAQFEIQSGQDQHALQLLQACPPDQRSWEWRYLHRLCTEELLTWKGHQKPVWGLAVSRDGRRLASAAGFWGTRDAGELFLWDTVTGKCQHQLRGHDGPVLTVAFRPDDQVVASGSQDGAVKLWQAATGTLLRTLPNHPGGV